MLSCVWKSNKALALGFEISTENLNPPIPKTLVFFWIVQCSLEHFGENEPAFASFWGGEMKDAGDEVGSPLACSFICRVT